MQKFLFDCEVCGHTFRDDALGKNLQSLNLARRWPAQSRVKSPDAFHHYHIISNKVCECCGCKAIGKK